MPADDFNRADSNSLGPNWTEVQSDPAVTRVESDQLVADDGELGWLGFAFWNEDVGGDHLSRLEYRSYTSSGMVYPVSGPAVRIAPGSTLAAFTGYVALCDPFGELVELRKFVAEPLGGWGTVLGSSSATFVTGDIFEIGIAGNVITVKRNGVSIVTAVDGAISGGRPGVVSLDGYMF